MTEFAVTSRAGGVVRWWRDGRGVMIVFQGERSERPRAATGKADRTSASGSRAGPRGSEHEVSAQRANWNVVSTADYDGKVLERVRLTPYGQPTFDVETANGDYDGDGDTDSADYDTLLNTCWGNYSGACRIFDYDDNGVIAIGDIFDFLALYPAATTVQRQPGRRTSPNHFPHAHQGLYLDEETMTYQNRHRQYAPSQSRFMQRDPVELLHPGKRLGANSYEYLASGPANQRDPSGLFPPPVGWCGRVKCDHPYSGNCWPYMPDKYNYCGPGWSGGKCVGCDGPSAPPTGPVDSCCAVHDGCYKGEGPLAPTPCNEDLCGCLGGAAPDIGALPIWLAFACWQYGF